MSTENTQQVEENAEEQGTQEQKKEIEISNLNDVMNVFLGAIEIGRTNGIYSWDELEIIGKSIKFLKNNLTQND